MKSWTRWQDWATVIVGGALVLAPWLFGVVAITGFAVNAWFVGALFLLIGLFALSQPQRQVAEWIALILGTWLFLSPWLFAFTATPAALWTAWCLGLAIMVTSILTLGGMRSLSPEMSK